MSDHYLSYVSAQPSFQPTLSAAEEAKRLLSSFLPEAVRVHFAFSSKIEFIHPGQNWSGVCCSSCGKGLDHWWNDAMNKAFESNFELLTSVAPCCGNEVLLNELCYGSPSGFAKFSLVAMNPNSKGLSPEQLAQIASVLGTTVREIPVHL